MFTRQDKDLYNAVDANDMDEVKSLVLKGVSSTAYESYDGRTAINLSSSYGYINILKLLVESGGDINARNKDGWTAMKYAVICGKKNILKRLVDSGGDINVRDKDGLTPIILAACKRNTDILKLLVDSGGDINIRDKNGLTAIIWASFNGSIDCLKLLIDSGGDINVRDKKGESAVDYAKKKRKTDCFKYLKKHLIWLSRRNFIMFLATQAYLPAVPPPLPDSMSRYELNDYYDQFYNPETRPNTSAVHKVFFMQELQRYIMSFLGPDNGSISYNYDIEDEDRNDVSVSSSFEENDENN